MSLIWIMTALFVGGVLAALAARFSPQLSRWVSLLALALAALAAWPLFGATALVEPVSQQAGWLSIWQVPWIPRFGISLLFAADGISLVLIALTLFLGIIALLAAWGDIHLRVGFFHFNLLWTLAGVIGVFTALDLFLFFFFWEVMLIPMFLIIAIWGHEDRRYAALKFFIYTQVSSLLMLVAMLALVWMHWQQSGELTFSWFSLLNTDTDSITGLLIMLGFFIAFLVKLPAFPFHNWLPDAHTQAPTAGSVILAGILLKTGAYGLLRFIVPLFPEAALSFTPWALTIGVISILYGAKLAFAQNDLKRLIAYTSISHMGFIILGIFSWNVWSLQGTLMQMVAHGLSSAGLFALAGTLQHRLHTRALDKMGGLWTTLPRMAAIGSFFAIAALGLPGLGNFVGEFLVLLGTFQRYPLAATLAALAMVLAPVYALIILQKTFYGTPSTVGTHSSSSVSSGTSSADTHSNASADTHPSRSYVLSSEDTHRSSKDTHRSSTDTHRSSMDTHLSGHAIADFNARELSMMALLMVALLALGFFPGLLTDLTAPSLEALHLLGRSIL